MLTYIIAASINEIENLKPLKNHTEEELKVIVIDEGDKKVRLRNDEHLKDIPHEHFGPKERENGSERGLVRLTEDTSASYRKSAMQRQVLDSYMRTKKGLRWC